MAMSASDILATTSGINDALSLFYTIGGSILVTCAGIWGFNRVMSLLKGESAFDKHQREDAESDRQWFRDQAPKQTEQKFKSMSYSSSSRNRLSR